MAFDLDLDKAAGVWILRGRSGWVGNKDSARRGGTGSVAGWPGRPLRAAQGSGEGGFLRKSGK